MSRRQILAAGAGLLGSPHIIGKFWPQTPPSISSVPTTIAAIIGTHHSGPINQPLLIDSTVSFNALFGAFSPNSGLVLGTLPYAVTQFFNNGGQSCYVVRVSDPRPETLLGQLSHKTGIYSLEKVPLFNLLVLTGVANRPLWLEAEKYCVSRRAFLILDTPGPNLHPTVLSSGLKEILSAKSDHAAIYYPWIVVPDLFLANKSVSLPPSASVAGICVRTDLNGGVWKTPAGLSAQLIGVNSLTYQLSDAETDKLTELNINCLRSLPQSRTIVWGGRTFQDPGSGYEFRYLSSRRLAIFVEESILQGLTWTAFEPNKPNLWANVRSAISTFLLQLFRQGAFQGSTPESAFFVKCDSTTMTPTNINEGKLIALVGIAPLKPSEFTVIEISLKVAQH